MALSAGGFFFFAGQVRVVHTGAYEHPSPQVLRDALSLLSKDLSAGFDHALHFLEYRYAPDKLASFNSQAMQAWAKAVMDAASRQAF